MAIVSPTDRPKSVRNRSVIELFCGVVCAVILPFWHVCWCKGFCYRTESDLFENYRGQMYPAELEIKDTTESNTSASYLDFHLSIESDGQLRTSLYDKRDDFNFHITNFPFPSSNIPSSPAYGVFISQLIRYARACSSYECFILKAARLSSKLLGQGYVMERLKSSLRVRLGYCFTPYQRLWLYNGVPLVAIYDTLGIRRTCSRLEPPGSFIVDMGISSNIMKSPFPKCYMTFWDMTMYNDTINYSDITPICELITELDFVTDFHITTTWWVSLLVDQGVPEGTCSQVVRSTSVSSWRFESIKIVRVKIDWNRNFVGLLHHPFWL